MGGVRSPASPNRWLEMEILFFIIYQPPSSPAAMNHRQVLKLAQVKIKLDVRPPFLKMPFVAYDRIGENPESHRKRNRATAQPRNRATAQPRNSAGKSFVSHSSPSVADHRCSIILQACSIIPQPCPASAQSCWTADHACATVAQTCGIIHNTCAGIPQTCRIIAQACWTIPQACGIIQHAHSTTANTSKSDFWQKSPLFSLLTPIS